MNLNFRSDKVKDYIEMKNITIDFFCKQCCMTNDEFDLLIDDNNNSWERLDLITSVVPILADLMKLDHMYELFDRR